MKMIRKTIKSYQVTITDARTGAVLKNFFQMFKPKNEKVAIDYIKETGKTAIEISVAAIEEIREMPFNFFMENSKTVDINESGVNE
jgi:hypothetical protein